MYGVHKIPFYISNNKVILSEGLKDGSIPSEYFRAIYDFKKNKYIEEAPINYLCVFTCKFTCEDPKEKSDKTQELISFTLTLLNPKTKSKKSFETFIRPTIEPKLSEYCINKTGVAQKDVDSGHSI